MALTIAIADGQGTLSINGQPVSLSYNASASSGIASVSKTTTILATQQDFIGLGPDLNPLFDVSFGENQITITALEHFIAYSDGYMDFNWSFSLLPTSGESFTGANLVSSSLYSCPPFTFPFNPAVSFDATSDSISVGGFLTDGLGTLMVNNGGVAIIGFTTKPTPEPSTCALFGLGGLTFLWHHRNNVSERQSPR